MYAMCQPAAALSACCMKLLSGWASSWVSPFVKKACNYRPQCTWLHHRSQQQFLWLGNRGVPCWPPVNSWLSHRNPSHVGGVLGTPDHIVAAALSINWHLFNRRMLSRLSVHIAARLTTLAYPLTGPSLQLPAPSCWWLTKADT